MANILSTPLPTSNIPTITDAAFHGLQLGRQNRERGEVQTALGFFDTDPDKALAIINGIDPALGGQLEDRLRTRDSHAVQMEIDKDAAEQRALAEQLQGLQITAESLRSDIDAGLSPVEAWAKRQETLQRLIPDPDVFEQTRLSIIDNPSILDTTLQEIREQLDLLPQDLVIRAGETVIRTSGTGVSGKPTSEEVFRSPFSGASAGGSLVPRTFQLPNGDQVRVFTRRNETGEVFFEDAETGERVTIPNEAQEITTTLQSKDIVDKRFQEAIDAFDEQIGTISNGPAGGALPTAVVEGVIQNSNDLAAAAGFVPQFTVWIDTITDYFQGNRSLNVEGKEAEAVIEALNFATEETLSKSFGVAGTMGGGSVSASTVDRIKKLTAQPFEGPEQMLIKLEILKAMLEQQLNMQLALIRTPGFKNATGRTVTSAMAVILNLAHLNAQYAKAIQDFGGGGSEMSQDEINKALKGGSS